MEQSIGYWLSTLMTAYLFAVMTVGGLNAATFRDVWTYSEEADPERDNNMLAATFIRYGQKEKKDAEIVIVCDSDNTAREVRITFFEVDLGFGESFEERQVQYSFDQQVVQNSDWDTYAPNSVVVLSEPELTTVLHLFATSDRFQFRVEARPDEWLYRDFDITGSREVVPRLMMTCGIEPPPAAPPAE